MGSAIVATSLCNGAQRRCARDSHGPCQHRGSSQTGARRRQDPSRFGNMSVYPSATILLLKMITSPPRNPSSSQPNHPESQKMSWSYNTPSTSQDELNYDREEILDNNPEDYQTLRIRRDDLRTFETRYADALSYLIDLIQSTDDAKARAAIVDQCLAIYASSGRELPGIQFALWVIRIERDGLGMQPLIPLIRGKSSTWICSGITRLVYLGQIQALRSLLAAIRSDPGFLETIQIYDAILAVFSAMLSEPQTASKQSKELLGPEILLIAGQVASGPEIASEFVAELIIRSVERDSPDIISWLLDDLLVQHPASLRIWPGSLEPTEHTVRCEDLISRVCEIDRASMTRWLVDRNLPINPEQMREILESAIQRDQQDLIRTIMVKQQGDPRIVSMINIFKHAVSATMAHSDPHLPITVFARADLASCHHFHDSLYRVARDLISYGRFEPLRELIEHYTPIPGHQPCTCSADPRSPVHDGPIPIYQNRNAMVRDIIRCGFMTDESGERSSILDYLAQYSRLHDLPIWYYLVGDVLLITHSPSLPSYQKRYHPLAILRSQIMIGQGSVDAICISTSEDRITDARAREAILATFSKSARG